MGVVATIRNESEATPEPVAGGYGELPNSPPYRIALLALDTGDIIWQSAATYGGSADVILPTLLVDQQRIFLSDHLGSIYALDLISGQQQWHYSYDRTPPPGLDRQLCPAGLNPPGYCLPRAAHVMPVAVKGSTLYFADPATARVTALSTEDGSEHWRVTTFGRAPTMTIAQRLIAFDDGVAVLLSDPEAAPDAPSYFGFWSADDGTEAWSIETLGGVVVSDGTALFVTQSLADQLCCRVDRIDAKTGVVTWSESFDGAHVEGYLASGSLVLSVVKLRNGEQFPEVDGHFGINPETGEEVWRMQMPHVSCFPIFPVADNGDVACLDYSTTSLRSYRLVISSP
jgi:outer membrane protein assembly factor BamB